MAKDRSLKISKGDNILHWDDTNFYAHSIILAQFTCKLLEKSGFDNKIIHMNSLILYQINPHYL